LNDYHDVGKDGIYDWMV